MNYEEITNSDNSFSTLRPVRKSAINKLFDATCTLVLTFGMTYIAIHWLLSVMN